MNQLNWIYTHKKYSIIKMKYFQVDSCYLCCYDYLVSDPFDIGVNKLLHKMEYFNENKFAKYFLSRFYLKLNIMLSHLQAFFNIS